MIRVTLDCIVKEEHVENPDPRLRYRITLSDKYGVHKIIVGGDRSHCIRTIKTLGYQVEGA